MSIIPYQNGNFSIKQSDVAFYEGQDTQSISILIQGNMDVYLSPRENCTSLKEEEVINESFRLFLLTQNTFLGVNDLYNSGRYTYSYRAAEDARVYTMVAKTTQQAKECIQAKKEYAVHIIKSLTSLISQSYATLVKIEGYIVSLNAITEQLCGEFWLLKQKYNLSITPQGTSFIKGGENKFKQTTQEIEPKIDYYQRMGKLPFEILKGFFNVDVMMTDYQSEEMSNILDSLIPRIKKALHQINQTINLLYITEGESIFSLYLQAFEEVKKRNGDTSELIKGLETIFCEIKNVSVFIKKEYDYKINIDITEVEAKIFQVNGKIACKESHSIKTQSTEGEIPKELVGSLDRILHYSQIPRERVTLFYEDLETFKKAYHKSKNKDEFRGIIKNITEIYFEIYEAVFHRVNKEENKDKLYQMFLQFGYMDEKLLKPQHSTELFGLTERQMNGKCSVYHMQGWLSKIVEMEKDPSVNQFGQDYSDLFREKKKRGDVTDKDKHEYDHDVQARVKHEIENLFKINHRLCYGQINSYFPILHDEMIDRDFSKAQITPNMIEDTIQKILDVDFSAFHREVSYRNADKEIEKEFIMKSATPDFILVPTFGSRAIMWQELSGRARTSQGRFILPMFTCENLDEMLIRLVANFRWELCKTMMGASWNDVSQGSITADYTDYIQFYKKSKDLSEEAKEKVTAQIQKYHNNVRDIFAADYETWINLESKGIVRLNKVARGILYKHCPFPKQTREMLQKQPIFTDIATRFRIGRENEAKKIENRYNKWIKAGIELDDDLKENLNFYKNM